MNPGAHSVHMALRAVVVYLFTNITSKYTHILKTENGVTKTIEVEIQVSEKPILTTI